MATYTGLDQVDLAGLAARYGLEDVHAVPIVGGAVNSSFLLDTAAGEFVLTVLDGHDAASAAELARRTRMFAALGVPTGDVVPDTSGNLVTAVGPLRMMVKRWLPGRVHTFLPASLLPAAGMLLARLHLLPPAATGLPSGTRRLSKADMAGMADMAGREDRTDPEFRDWVIRTAVVPRPHPAPGVVCHGDLFVDNLVERPDGSLAVIDWETASIDDPVFDLGMAAVGLCQSDDADRIDPTRLALLLDGYTRLRPLPDADRARLPDTVVEACVLLAIHRYHRRGTGRAHRQLLPVADSARTLGRRAAP